MELLVKLYTDKPTRVGIKFMYEYKAVRAYEQLITMHRGETFILKVEPVKDKLNITLQSEQSGIKIPYKDIDYKMDQFHKLALFADKEISFQFVHIYSNANVILVAKPFRKEEFVLVSKIEIVSHLNF